MTADEQSAAIPQIQAIDKDQEEMQPKPSDTDLVKAKAKAKATSHDELSPDEEKEGSEESSSSSRTSTPEDNQGSSSSQPWQAVYAPQYNAYYFHNTETGETTWENPLQPSDHSAPVEPAEPSSALDPVPPEPEHSSGSAAHYSALHAAALAQGIDPSLAHLDPSLLAATSPGAPGPIPTFQAKFNARTGTFTRPDARTPGHLSEYERMKRMSEFYFDVNAWEQQLADEKSQEEQGDVGKKKKRPTKKDLERFKERKQLKKIAKTAWLRT